MLCAASVLHLQPPTLSSVSRSFLPLIFLGTASGQIPAPGTFAPSAFPSPPKKSSDTAPKDFLCPCRNAVARFGSSGLSLLGAQKNGAEKRDIFRVLLELSIQLCARLRMSKLRTLVSPLQFSCSIFSSSIPCAVSGCVIASPRL